MYVHIPFCARRCDYCAFATWTDRDHLISDYTEACRKELQGLQLPAAASVFFGGGTPSLIPPDQLVSILECVDRENTAEVTVECNPDTVEQRHFDVYARGGVNRISLGVQSMIPSVLNSLGRTHCPENVHKAVLQAQEAGIDNFNVDLIYGAKGESLDDWSQSLQAVLELNPRPKHISAYGLTVEPGTPLARDTRRHPDDDDQADKYLLAEEELTAAGYRNYEVSNWAVPGYESVHNRLYWNQNNYRGIGCAAHSHHNGRRWWNVRTPERYIAAIEAGNSPEAAHEVLDDETRRFEGLELALRTREGVPVDVVPFDELAGLIEAKGDRAVLTVRGRLMANAVAIRLR